MLQIDFAEWCCKLMLRINTANWFCRLIVGFILRFVGFVLVCDYVNFAFVNLIKFILCCWLFLVLFKTVMERYFKRKSTEDNLLPSTTNIPESSNEHNIENILANLPGEPRLRLRILEYDPIIRDQVRRAYLQRELVQPQTHQFPYTSFAGVQRRFNPKWFDDFPTWLEYSISKNVVFCRSCYLFKLEIPEQAGNDNFTSKGFIIGRKNVDFEFMLEVLIVLTTKLYFIVKL